MKNSPQMIPHKSVIGSLNNYPIIFLTSDYPNKSYYLYVRIGILLTDRRTRNKPTDEVTLWFRASSRMKTSIVFRRRQPLHSILSAVSFQGQKETFIALAVTLQPVSTLAGYSGGGGDGANCGTLRSSSSSSSDVIFASCLVFQANSSEEAATFVKDLKDIFVVAMRSKSPP